MDEYVDVYGTGTCEKMGFLYKQSRLVKIGYVLEYDSYYEVEIPSDLEQNMKKVRYIRTENRLQYVCWTECKDCCSNSNRHELPSTRKGQCVWQKLSSRLLGQDQSMQKILDNQTKIISQFSKIILSQCVSLESKVDELVAKVDMLDSKISAVKAVFD